MSSDDGIYIARYVTDDTTVFSVVHCHFPHRLDDATFNRIWGDGRLFLDKAEACLYAVELDGRVGSEYGARMVEHVSHRPPASVVGFLAEKRKTG
jgi:hypothetical protein